MNVQLRMVVVLISAWIHYFHTHAVVMRVLHKMKMATTAQVEHF